MREGAGLVLLVAAFAAMAYAVQQLRVRDYLACIVLVLTGTSLVRAGVELLRPSIGE
jgi:hypothetical protein